jgi:hypothetical protein
VGKLLPPFEQRRERERQKSPAVRVLWRHQLLMSGPGSNRIFSVKCWPRSVAVAAATAPPPFTRNNYSPTTYYFISSLLIFTLDNVSLFFAEIIKKIWLRKYRVICNNIFPNKNQVNVVF